MTGQPPHTLVLVGDAGIKAAAEVAASLKTALASKDHVDVDTRAMTSADLTTAQSLLSARATASAQGKTLHLLAPLGAPLTDMLAKAGFLADGQPHRAFWAATSDHA